MFAGPLSRSVVALGLITGAIYVAAGRGAPPTLTIDKPDRFVGQAGSLDVTAEAPNARFTALTDHARAERPDDSRCSRSTAPPPRPSSRRSIRITCASRVRSASERARPPAGRRAHRRHRDTAVVPQPASALRARPRRTSRCASSRRASRCCRRITTSTTAAPRWSSTRRTPPDVASGVRVGDVEYPGFPHRRGADRPASRSRSSRCSTIRTSTRRSSRSRATRRATRRRRTSSTTCSRSRSRKAASSSTTSSSTASCRTSSSTRRS